MTSASQILDTLTGEGLRLQVGPFQARLRSHLPEVRAHVACAYGEFPAREGAGGHFDIAIVSGDGLHRWFRRQACLSIGGRRFFLPLPHRLAGPLVDWGLNWCVGQTAHQWVALHSAVVERGGRALIMPAAPGSGKSTLCTALAHSGWRFFSDEFALVHPNSGRIHALPRPISLKNASIDIMRARYPGIVTTVEQKDMEDARFVHVRPPSESVSRAAEDAEAGWIIFPKYSAHSPTTITPLSKAECLIDLLDQSFNYNYLGARGFNCLADLVRRVDCYRLTYSDLDDVLDRLATLALG